MKSFFEELSNSESTPHEIALGFAVGTFFAILPTPGFSFFLGFLFAMVYKKVNKLSLFGSLALFNPIVNLPFYTLSYIIGDALYGTAPVVTFKIIFLDTVINYTRRFLTGAFIIALGMSVIGYILIRLFSEINNYKKRKRLSKKN